MRTLSLILDGNHLRDTGAQNLARLNHSVAIDDLTFNLRDDKIGDWWAMALGRLTSDTALRRLNLQSESNRITKHGMTQLVRHWKVGNLQAVNPGLADNGLRDGGAKVIADLKHSNTLEELGADLSYNEIGSRTAKALAKLNESPPSRILSSTWPAMT